MTIKILGGFVVNVYDFNVKTNQGQEILLSQYKGKVLLIVNTATKCGLTGQYEALESLYQKYKGKGFEILDFPCNQFLKQSPGTAEEIESFCTMNYNTTFPRFAKVDVNGKEAHPLFIWLKDQASEDEGDKKSKAFEKTVRLLKPFNKSSDIKWNFGKFLIDRNGNVVGRYSPAFIPEKLEEIIASYLI